MANNSAGPIKLFILGDARIETPVASIEPTAEIVFAAALYLILARNESSMRRAVQRMLWPKIESSVAAHRLRQTMLKLRRLGLDIETIGKSRIRLGNDSVFVDYEECLARGEAFEFENYELLPGYDPQFSSQFAEWLDAQRQLIGGSITRAVISTLSEYRSSGKWEALETVASAARKMAPYNEEITLALAESFAMRGAKLEAFRILDEYLAEVGPGSRDLRLQATTMRRRIADDHRESAGTAGNDLPLVGRAIVLHELSGLLANARAGKSQAFMLIGDAGIGKSRLLAECASFAGLQGVNVQRIHCRFSYAHRPLSAFVELVPSLRTLRGAIGCAPETLAYLDRLTRLEVSESTPATDDIDPNWIYGSVLRALFDIFDAVSEDAPLLIQIEDAHWLDQTSAQVLGDMFVWCQSRPVLFAMTARDVPDVWQQAFPESLRCIQVTPLEAGAAKELVTTITRKHGHSIDTSRVDWCVTVGEGNPYFLQELATHWIETGANHEVPPSLSALLGRRVDRLDRDALQLLQTCAILENNSTLDRLERVLEYEAHRLLNGINILGTAGMVVSEHDEREGSARSRITSKHELLSNVALTRLSAPAKAFLHRRAALILEQEVQGNFSTAVLWDCAKHWWLAGDPQRGLSLALSCGHHLMKVGLPKAAADAYAKCLPLCTTDRQRWEVLEAETVSYYRLSDWHRVHETFAMARLLKSRVEPSLSVHDDLELMDLRAEWQNLEWNEIASKALHCLNAEEASPRHRIEAGVMAMMLLGCRHDRNGIRETFERIENLSPKVEEAPSLRLQAAMVFHTAIGDLSKGVEAARHLIIEQRERGHVSELFRAHCNAAVTFRVSGLFDEAQQSLVDALKLAESHSMELSMIVALPMLANLALERGRVTEAKAWHEKLIRLTVHPSNRFGQLEAKGISVRLALADGNVQLARNELLMSKEEAMSDKVFHRRAYNCALQIATDLMAVGKTDQDILECMAHAFDKSKASLHQAYSACVLYAGLVEDGQNARAVKIFEDYKLHHRREPWPVPDHLLAPLLQERRVSQPTVA